MPSTSSAGNNSTLLTLSIGWVSVGSFLCTMESCNCFALSSTGFIPPTKVCNKLTMVSVWSEPVDNVFIEINKL